MKFLNNEKGLSLIELVASIVIISIILISFFGVFIQSSKYTKFNEEMLTSVEVAEDVIADIRSNPNAYKNNGSSNPSYSNYSVLLLIGDGPNGLKKATIEVKPETGKGIKKSTFITHIYYEVTP